ncbi:MAG: hypothetical protein AAGJ29_02165 [Pseudomonadota bacterium]
MRKTADSIITDFKMTLEFYKSQHDLTSDMVALVELAEPMVEALERVRLYQIMQGRLQALGDGAERHAADKD